MSAKSGCQSHVVVEYATLGQLSSFLTNSWSASNTTLINTELASSNIDIRTKSFEKIEVVFLVIFKVEYGTFRC